MQDSAGRDPELSGDRGTGGQQDDFQIHRFEFEFRMGDRIPAKVTRKWSGAGNGYLGRSTYALIFDEEAPDEIRKVIIGGMVALDLIREKERN